MAERGGEEGASKRAHVLVFPFPSQGHINPLLQFGKRLLDRGLKVSLVTTVFLAKSMEAHTGPICLESISDGCDDNGREQAGSIEAYLVQLRTTGSESLRRLIRRLQTSGSSVDCLVYDSFVTWALEVARETGVRGASFLTQSCAVDAVYYHAYRGTLPETDLLSGKPVSLPGLPPLRPSELPSFVSKPGLYPAFLDILLGQYRNLGEADWVLCNTFDELEHEEMKWLNQHFPVKAVGPTVPSLYLDKRIDGDDDYGFSLWKKEGGICREWLDARAAESVVYVSFGSRASLTAEQMEEIAAALAAGRHCFLWVVLASEESKLPDHFREETAKEKGLIVRWCPQLEVLSHRAVGGFVTHCGWSSTLEGLSLGMPMVAFPQVSDQPTNGKYIEEVWEVGVRAAVGERGVVGRKEMERCVREVMEGEGREEMKRNAGKWRKLAVQALQEDGSSDKNIQEFVSALRGAAIFGF